MDDRSYAVYLVFAVLGSSFALIWNYFYLSAGVYSKYVSAIVGVLSVVWFAVNLAVIFIEGLEPVPDARKLFLPAWYVVGFIAAVMHAVYNLPQAPSFLMIGTTFATWWVVIAVVAALVELVLANVILVQMNSPE